MFVITTVVVPSSGEVLGCIGVMPFNRPPVVNPPRISDKSRLVVPAELKDEDEDEKMSCVVCLGVVVLVVFLNI